MTEKESFICRFCGKIGFIGKKSKVKDLRGEIYYINKNQRCKNCKSKFIDDAGFEYWEEMGLTSGNQLNKRFKQIYKLTGKSSTNDSSLFSEQDLHDLYIDQDAYRDYSDEYIKKIIKKKKDYYKPTKKKEKKIKKYLNKNTISELSKVFLFILITFPFFVISPLMGISVVFIAAVWYSLLQGDFWR